MASSKWKSFTELNTVLSEREFIFWGASNWIERTLESINSTPLFIVDKSELNQGIKYNNFDVIAPNEIDLNHKPFVIISTVNYMSVIEDLDALGYVMGEDYCCTPLLNVRKDKDDLQNHSQSILISSSQHSSDGKTGGGLYQLDMNPRKITKVYTGKGRGICKGGNKYFLIDMLRGVVVLDMDFNEIEIIELQKNSEPHGVCYDEHRNWIFIGQPGRDSVAAYDLVSKKLVKEFFISSKWSKNKKDNHHVNDPYVKGDSLFISMFSFSGNWLNEIYDGGVIEFDIETMEKIGTPIKDMWMPHSITRVDGKLSILNSMHGELWSGSYDLVSKVPGFARGLAYDGKYFYIGITEHRYPEKLYGISNCIGIDTGISIVHPSTKLTTFISLNDFFESIHSVIIK